MVKIVKKIFFTDFDFELGEYKREFHRLRKKFNIEKAKIAAKVVIVLNVILLLIDILFYKKNLANGNAAYKNLLYSHIIILFFLFFWQIILNSKKRSHNINNEIMCYIVLNVILYWCVFLGLNSLNISGQITAYIIGLLCSAVFINLTPLESIIIYGLSYVNFVMGLTLLIEHKGTMYSHIINSTILFICAIIASDLRYLSLMKDFLNNKKILESQLELKELNNKLTQYEKVRTDFFANISHELRTPINVIYSAEQMMDYTLNSREAKPKEINKYLKMVKQNSYRLIRLINNLIDITKIDATVFSVSLNNCDIVSIVEEIVLSVAEYIENRGIALIFDTDVEEKIIAFDPEKMERIILNLLSNAVKFTKLGGEILVKISVDQDKVTISVKDDGVGISEEMQKYIFDRFVQVDKSISRNREGSGIGLSMVKSLIELQGGNISVSSQLGQGSEFIVTLPNRTVDEMEKDEYINSLREQRIEKIQIEFSDIYE